MDTPPPLALVTGAAHRLGKAAALALAKQGYAIGLHYRQSEAEARQTAALLNQSGAPVLLLPADLTQPAEIQHLFETLQASPYPLQVLVNSAACFAAGDLRTLSVEEWDAVMALNLRAPWLMAQAAARIMPPGSAIINISDVGAQRAWLQHPAYTVSKAGLDSLTRLLARTLAPNIRVNALAPGLVLPSEDLSAERWTRLVQRLPLQHAGSLEAFAQALLFLVQSPDITGQTLVIDCGYDLL